jgi:outer membrane protein
LTKTGLTLEQAIDIVQGVVNHIAFHMRILFLLVGACASACSTAATIENPLSASTPASEISYSIGLAGGAASRYVGSKEYRPVALPVFAAKTSGGLFASTIDGVGYGFHSRTGIFGSSALSYDLGREDTKSANRPGSDYLHGMGEVKGSVVSALQLGFALTPQLAVIATSRAPLTQRERGISMRTAIQWDAVKTGQNVVTLGSGFLIGSKKYNQTFFGVTQAQSHASGFAKYDARTGVYGVDATLSWTHTLAPKWSISSAVTATSLLGDVAASPIVQKRSSLQAFTGIMYTY